MHDSSTSSLLSMASKQPYRINNCKFQNSMLGYVSELHTTKAFTDVVLHAEGKFLNAHRIILAAGSSYFNNLLKSLTTSPRSSPECSLVVALPNVKYKDLERVVKFIYLGYLDIVNSELEGFVQLAKLLGVVGMSDDDDEDEEEDEEEALLEDAPVVDQTPQRTNSMLRRPVPASAPPTTSSGSTTTALVEAVYEEDDDEDDDGGAGEEDVVVPLEDHVSGSPSEFVQVSYTDEDEVGGYEAYVEDDDDMYDEDSYVAPSSSSFTHNNASVSSAHYGHDKPFVCLKCGKTYNSNKSLWRHRKFTCDEKIQFTCNVCGKVFSRSDNLRRHVVVAHSQS